MRDRFYRFLEEEREFVGCVGCAGVEFVGFVWLEDADGEADVLEVDSAG